MCSTNHFLTLVDLIFYQILLCITSAALHYFLLDKDANSWAQLLLGEELLGTT